MTKLQAALKESSSRQQSLALAKVGYRCGSFFKGCAFCGDTEMVETPSGCEVKRYTSGYNVYRAYEPSSARFTWWCYDCGAKDLQCWEPDDAGMVKAELGKPPVQGSRDAKAHAKYLLRKSLPKMDAVVKTKVPTRNMEIARLENELARLLNEIKEMAK